MNVLLVLVLIISVIMGSTHDRKIHFLFPIHIAMAMLAFGISINWFATGQEFVFSYGSVWTIVERGSLDALSSVMSIVGVSCILLGWTYSERDKTTLGKRQIDMIHLMLGYGYALSLVTHFAATALCIVMTKCSAKEAALWAFLTVLWGCIPQATICLCVALNRTNREKLALKLWRRESEESSNKFTVVQDMIGYLGDSNVRYNCNYRDTMSEAIVYWLRNCYERAAVDHGITADNIKTASTIFRDLSEHVPDKERTLLEEDVLKSVCELLPIIEHERNEVALVLFCCGYYRFIYAQTSTDTNQRIDKIAYFSQRESDSFQYLVNSMKTLNCGLEWYQFLKQRLGVPEYVSCEIPHASYMGLAFEQLILSIFEGDGQNVQQDARLAWNQVNSGGEER